MDEDELRAFLESATTGGQDDDGTDEAIGDEIDDSVASDDPLAAVRRGEAGADAANQQGQQGQQDQAEPSFDELMGLPGASAPQAAPQATPAASEPEITPIVLPGPADRRKPPGQRSPVQQPPAQQPPAQRPPVQQPQPVAAVEPPLTKPAMTEPAPTEPIEQISTGAVPPPQSAAASADRQQEPPATAQLPTEVGLAALINGGEDADAHASHRGASGAAGANGATGAAGANGLDGANGADGDEYEKIAVTGGEKKRGSKFVPWIVTGAGAVVVLIVAIIIVFSVRGAPESEPTAAPSPSEPVPTTSEPAPEPTVEPDEPDESERNGDTPPTVEVGPTGEIPIPLWGVTGQISAKFGWPQYTIDANDNLIFNGGTLLPQFPESCAAMRTGFGITQVSEGKFEVYRPAEVCADAPELFNEVWGLTAAIIPTLAAS